MFQTVVVLGALLGLAHSAPLSSRDGAFSIELSDDWREVVTANPEIVLAAKSGKGFLQFSRHEGFLSRKELSRRLRKDLVMAKKKRAKAVKGPLNDETGSGESLSYIRYNFKGKLYRTAHLNLKESSYALFSYNLTDKEFQGVIDSLYQAAPPPQPDASSEQPRAESAAEAVWVKTTDGKMEFSMLAGFSEKALPGAQGVVLSYADSQGKALMIASLPPSTEIILAQPELLAQILEPLRKQMAAECSQAPIVKTTLSNGWPGVTSAVLCPNASVSIIVFVGGGSNYMVRGMHFPSESLNAFIGQGRLTQTQEAPAAEATVLVSAPASSAELPALPQRRARLPIFLLIPAALGGLLWFGFRQVRRQREAKAALLQASPAAASSAPAAAPLASSSDIDAAFQRDKFLLRQKLFSISEKYLVWDEQGGELLFVERPARLLRNLGAIFAAVAVGIIGFFLMGFLLGFVPQGAQNIFVGLYILFWGAGAFYTGFRLYPKRHMRFYRNETMDQALLEVFQDQKFAPITVSFTVKLPGGPVLAILSKNYLYNAYRKRWYIHRPDGSLWATAMEDSIVLALLRRFLGNLWGLLRTNFLIYKGSSEEIMGEFNRKMTLLDRYVLDLSQDPGRELDRRVALALGVLLDTAEKR